MILLSISTHTSTHTIAPSSVETLEPSAAAVAVLVPVHSYIGTDDWHLQALTLFSTISFRNYSIDDILHLQTRWHTHDQPDWFEAIKKVAKKSTTVFVLHTVNANLKHIECNKTIKCVPLASNIFLCCRIRQHFMHSSNSSIRFLSFDCSLNLDEH